MTCRDKTVIKTDLAPAAIGPYSVAVAGGPFVFTAGQLGIDPKTGNLVEGGIEAETRQALKNLSSILEAANSCLENVVKTTVFLRDINDFAKMNAIYGEFFTENPPARSAVQVAALPKNGAVEIEAIGLTNKD
ncbi:MAG TPA: reactive intermediate/imine deaminase [Anaerolineaceae bacterium]|nr:reactive intermediate/imine deaminase [Anaerolineaceae bacterium]